MKIIDTHCHLDFEVFDVDRNDVLAEARAQGVSGFIVPGVMRSTWNNLIGLCEEYKDIYYALGLHPLFINSHHIDDISLLQNYLSTHQAVAVGEIGLDFYDRKLAIDKQIQIFESQLNVARQLDLPVILHVRKAHEEVLACLKKYPVCGGVVHAFNGSLQQAARYRKNNFKFGFGGMITYRRSTKLRSLARELPLESIVLETDAPDMTVESHQGERNSPAYLPECLRALADVRKMPAEDVAWQTLQNSCDLFKGM